MAWAASTSSSSSAGLPAVPMYKPAEKTNKHKKIKLVRIVGISIKHQFKEFGILERGLQSPENPVPKGFCPYSFHLNGRPFRFSIHAFSEPHQYDSATRPRDASFSIFPYPTSRSRRSCFPLNSCAR